jgi:hypothetical protein
MDKISQDKLLDIVRTWHINKGPQYRKFRCGNCRKALRRAWHCWLRKGSFRTPVHLCKTCRRKLNITYPKLKVYPDRLNLNIIQKLKKRFSALISKWNVSEVMRFRQFSCDCCRRNIYKAYHIFLKLENHISEVHICRVCWAKKIFK